MIVVKIGGSLYHSRNLPAWLSCITGGAESGIVIVPGGGPFADQVREAARQWNLPQACAHDMAVLGMQQYAHMMLGLNDQLELVDSIEEMMQGKYTNKAMVWAPYPAVKSASDIDKSWETTSDSLALWLATKLSAKALFLVKSAPVKDQSVQELINNHVIDQRFNTFLNDYSGRVQVYNAADSQKFLDYLHSEELV